MAKRTAVAIFVLAVGAAFPVAAGPLDEIPLYEPGFLEPVSGGACTPEDVYDQPNYYGSKCERLNFVFGPLTAKPGQNDVLIQPTTFEKPWYDGYIVRMKPNLVDAIGVVPPVERLHLHHGTWLNTTRNYGSGPWFASGEEKSILIMPQGYGIQVRMDDEWLLLHMIHNATPNPLAVYVTYSIDFVKQADAQALGIRNTRQIWLDVGGGKFHRDTDTYLLNPIFNIQRGFGGTDLGAFQGRFFTDPHAYPGSVCTWPRQNCARFNSEGKVSAQQGKPVVVGGKDYVIGTEALGTGVNEGTLVVIGGHVHPGGIRDEISVVRGATWDAASETYVGGVEKPIMVSDAVYWDYANPNNAGGTPTSWDFAMTGTTETLGWKVRVKRGDILRLNGVYDTSIGSWYEQMGIVMTWIAPGDTSGVDPFSPDVVFHPGHPTTATLPPGITASCTPGFDAASGKTVLCMRGTVTHGHITTSGNHGACVPGSASCPLLPASDGPIVDTITIQAFAYGPADLGVIRLAGIPRAKVNTPLRFVNLDTADYVWHTVTRCALPCTGPTTTNYPLADGGTGPMDFDSSELGIGLAPAQTAEWIFTPTETGTFTFWCRIHPPMRGAIKVVE